MDKLQVVKEEVAKCRRCTYLSKPFIEFKVYEMYRGKDVKVLVVSESPPPGKKSDFLYNLGHRDRLRRTLSRFFGVDEKELISRLVERGVLWDMAARCRPPSRRDVAFMARNCLRITAIEIEVLKPKRIVALGSVARAQVREALRICSYAPQEILEDHHPLYVVRFRRSEASEYFGRLKEALGV